MLEIREKLMNGVGDIWLSQEVIIPEVTDAAARSLVIWSRYANST